MKPAQVGAMIGGLVGLMTILLYKVVVIASPVITAILWPARIFMTALNGYGVFGHMMLDTLALVVNVLIYAAVGYGIGWLVPSRSKQ